MKDYLTAKNIEDESLESKVVDECVHYVMRAGRLWKYVGKDGRRLLVIYTREELEKVTNDVLYTKTLVNMERTSYGRR